MGSSSTFKFANEPALRKIRPFIVVSNQISRSKLVGNSDIRKCHVSCRSRVFEETSGKKASQIDIHRRMKVQCPKQFEICLTPYVSRFASPARAHERSPDLIEAVVEAFPPKPTPIEGTADVLNYSEHQSRISINQIVIPKLLT